MEMIGLFCPAMVSILIRERDGAGREQSVPYIIFRYGIYAFINVFLSTFVITFGLGISGVTADAFNSFPFFIKYSLIALVLAVIVPIVEEIIRKYIKITWNVRAYDEQTKTGGQGSK